MQISKSNAAQECAPGAYAAGEYWAMSRALRRGLVRYGFKPTEVLLVLILCEETFDAGRLSGRADLGRWSAELGTAWPERKLRKLVWEELIAVGVVDFNAGQGTYQLRPDMKSWSRTREPRAPRDDLRNGGQLPLVAERPLSEALSEVSREAVLDAAQPGQETAGPQTLRRGDYRAQWELVRLAAETGRTDTAALAGSAARPLRADIKGAVENSAAPPQEGPVNFAGAGGKFRRPPVENSAGMQVAHSPPDAELFTKPLAKLARSDQLASYGAAEKSAGTPSEALSWLEAIDRHGHLRQNGRSVRQWSELCARDAGYVLGKLRKAYESALAEYGSGMRDPLAFCARVARDDRRLR